jgi:hypothetical protein
MMPLPRPTVVPYVAAWTGEQNGLFSQLIIRADGRGLGYEDERPEERDTHGVLWARMTGERQGLPLFGVADPRRQREVMEQMLCQVCGGPSSRTSKGRLFLMPAPDEPLPPVEHEGAITGEGPVCLTCAAVAVDQCWSLKQHGAIAVRARKTARFGAYGSLYHPDASGRLILVSDDVTVAHGREDIVWLVAAKLLVELRRCTVVDLAAELRGGAEPGANRATDHTRSGPGHLPPEGSRSSPGALCPYP